MNEFDPGQYVERVRHEQEMQVVLQKIARLEQELHAGSTENTVARMGMMSGHTMWLPTDNARASAKLWGGFADSSGNYVTFTEPSMEAKREDTQPGVVDADLANNKIVVHPAGWILAKISGKLSVENDDSGPFAQLRISVADIPSWYEPGIYFGPNFGTKVAYDASSPDGDFNANEETHNPITIAGSAVELIYLDEEDMEIQVMYSEAGTASASVVNLQVVYLWPWNPPPASYTHPY